MSKKDGHSAEEVAGILRSAGYEITRRKVNYYAFEKKMFQPEGSGKMIFTRADIDKIQAILYLREKSRLNLDEIKKIINKEDFSLFDVEQRFGKKGRPKMFSMKSSGLKEDYEIEFFDQYIIMNVENKKVLLSTGIPVSLGRPTEAGNRLTLLAQVYNLPEDCLNVTVEKISKLIGTDLDVLLGCDILKMLHLSLDSDTKKATITDSLQDHRGLPLKVEMDFGVPVIEMTLAEKPLKLFFETGAKVSYLRRDLVENYPLVAEVRDFYPGLGEFDVNTHEIPVKLAGVNISVSFGSLPKELEFFLQRTGCDGILGLDFFRYFNPVYINLSGRLLSIKKRIAPLF